MTAKKLLIENDRKLNEQEIRSLMKHALDLLSDLERLTKKSIDHANTLISKKYKKAA